MKTETDLYQYSNEIVNNLNSLSEDLMEGKYTRRLGEKLYKLSEDFEYISSITIEVIESGVFDRKSEKKFERKMSRIVDDLEMMSGNLILSGIMDELTDEMEDIRYMMIDLWDSISDFSESLMKGKTKV
tara:strand:- start:54 stop:440 length:387 start_codon:yes stop_codon:yes gene_type:complete